jgi:hypothetical protein
MVRQETEIADERNETMSRLPQVAPETATGEAKNLLDVVKSKVGRVPAMT